MVLPYLNLNAPFEFGDYWLGPFDQFEGSWMSDEFAAAAHGFASSFRDAAGAPLGRGALLVRRGSGADGAPVEADEYETLQLVIGFATIDQNPYWSPDGAYEGWKVATSDNADLWMQPLDLEEGAIAIGRGGRVQATVGGGRLADDGFEIRAPLELHMPFGVSLDDEVLAAAHAVLASPSAEYRAAGRRLRVAIRWLLRSWHNTPSLSGPDRLVALKIASEALTGMDKSLRAAQAIEALFGGAREQLGGDLGVDDLLWRPDGPEFERTWVSGGQSKTESVPELIHWYMAFAESRNAIVHGEERPGLSYAQPGSSYEGPFVEIADRVVREAILIQLGECGYPAVWRKGLTRASFHAFEHLSDVAQPD